MLLVPCDGARELCRSGDALALNAGFVCIKVDREERPDVDQVYMAALQALGPAAGGRCRCSSRPTAGRSSVGRISRPVIENGSAGFLTLVNEVAKAWTKQHAEIDKTANEVTEAVRKRLKVASSRAQAAAVGTAAAEGLKQLTEQFDAGTRWIWIQPQ